MYLLVSGLHLRKPIINYPGMIGTANFKVDGFIVMQAGDDHHLSAPLTPPPPTFPLLQDRRLLCPRFAADYVIKPIQFPFDSIPPPPSVEERFPRNRRFSGSFLP